MMRTKSAQVEINISQGIIGAFTADSDLVGTLKYTLWDGLAIYSIGAMYIKPGIISRYDFSNPDNPITPILDFILQSMEDKKYYTWFYSRALSPGYHKIQKTKHDLLNQCKLGSRYDRFIMEVVPAGMRSLIKAHDNMLSNQVWVKNSMIVMCSLRNEFREWGDVFEKEPAFYA